MTKKMRPRWYCDHCRKSGGSAHWMRRHEESCTKNPQRICNMCQSLGLGVKLNVLKAIIEELPYGGPRSEPEKYAKLRDAAGGCPACLMAVLRQTHYVSFFRSFKYAEEKALWWREHPRPRMGDNYDTDW